MTSVQTQDKGTLPIPGKWEIDPSHSSVQFGAKHLGLSKIRGHFSSYSAEITWESLSKNHACKRSSMPPASTRNST